MSTEIKKTYQNEVYGEGLENMSVQQLHTLGLAYLDIAGDALVNTCKVLMIIKKKTGYKDFGFDSFEGYVEAYYPFKARSAYDYISSLEKLGEGFMQSNANLGITKLKMLTALFPGDRNEFMEKNDVEGMSTRELKEALEKVTKQGEQISFLTEENEKLKKDAEETQLPAEVYTELEEKQKKLDEANKKIKELESRPIDVVVADPQPKPDEKDLKKKIKEASDKAVEKALKQAETETAEKIKAAEKASAKAAADKLKSQLEQTESEKAELLRRTEELSKKLAVSANEDMVLINFNFETGQSSFNKILGSLRKMKDKETAEKLANGIIKFLDYLKSELDKILQEVKKGESND